MNKNQQAFAVLSICLSIILAGAVIAYKPGVLERSNILPTGFRYPTGVGVGSGASLFTGASVAEGEEAQKTISLLGTGSAFETADEATLSLGVEITRRMASEAIEDNAGIMAEVIEAIKLRGVSEDDIKTTRYSVYPRYEWVDDTRELKGYTVTNMIQVTVRDLDDVGNVIDVSGQAGANTISGISFGLSEAKIEELKVSAYILALGDAQDKAEVIADTLDLTISGIQSVTETSYTPARTTMDAVETSGVEGLSMAPTPIISGDLSVSVSVRIVFQFQ